MPKPLLKSFIAIAGLLFSLAAHAELLPKPTFLFLRGLVAAGTALLAVLVKHW